MNNIYVVYYWPDFEDSLEVVASEADAQELVFSFWESAAYDNYLSGLAWDPTANPRDYWDDDVYTLDFGYYQTHFLT